MLNSPPAVIALQISKLSLHAIEGEAPEQLRALSEEELEALQEPDVLSKRIALLEAQCHQLHPNLGAIAEYRRKVQSRGDSPALADPSPSFRNLESASSCR